MLKSFLASGALAVAIFATPALAATYGGYATGGVVVVQPQLDCGAILSPASQASEADRQICEGQLGIE